MPDISMCSSTTCLLKHKCYRNPASGTQPSEFRQSWFASMRGWGEDCRYYWPAKGRNNMSYQQLTEISAALNMTEGAYTLETKGD